MSRKQEEQLVSRIHDRLSQDSVVPDPTKISVKIEKRGPFFNRQMVAAVYGTISSESEGKRVINSVEAAIDGGEDVEVEDHLVVPLV
jgi:hypothetical protein